MQLFASGRDEPRARRPTDAALAGASILGLVLLGALSRIGADIDIALSEALASFPEVLDALWLLLLWWPLAWAALLVVAATVRRRLDLARDLLGAAALSLVLAALTSRVMPGGDWPGLDALFATTGPASFPPLAPVLCVAAISTAAPHLSRPFRHFGRWSVAGQLLAGLFLGPMRISGGLAAIAVGLLAASLVHLAVGSPGGRPTAGRIAEALRELGIDAQDLEVAADPVRGVMQVLGRDADGPLAVKMYGRDAWDGQLLASLWRAAWYRGSYRTARLSRIELVEHEAFMTLLAERAGVRGPTLVRAGSAGRGDALVVVRPAGEALGAEPGPFDPAQVDSLWSELALLHDAGIAMRWLDLDRMAVLADGTVGLADLADASLIEGPADVLRDRAQALAASIVLVGEEAAGPLCRERYGDDGLSEALPYLQKAAMPPGLLDALDRADVDLDDVRTDLGELVGTPPQPLVKLRRVSGRSLLTVGLTALAAYTLIGLVSQLDLEEFAQELRGANWWWLAFALLLAQLPRPASAVGTMGSIERPLPFGPLTALQFAICYVNLAIPSTAARVAVNIRFFQRCGVKPTTAVSAGVIDSVCGFVVQIAIFVTLFLLSDIDVDWSTELDQLSGVSTLVFVVLAVLVVAVIVALCFASVRRRVAEVYGQAREAMRVLRSPRKLLQLLGGNVVGQVLFAMALATCVFAFGEEVSLGQVLLINTVVSLFAGLLPVPGGIGVTEAGLTFGLVTAGLPAETAAAAALASRFTSFYLPPLWGFPCYQWLVKHNYL